MDRVQRMGLARQCQRLVLDAEQRRDEPIEVRPKRHHQLALVLDRQRIRQRPSRHQPGMQRRILGRQPSEEHPVQPHQSLAPRQFGEVKTKPERRSHGVHRNLNPSCAAV